MAALLQDSGSLERRKPISLNSLKSAQRDAEVLHNNFTAIDPHHCEGAEGSGWWQPEGEEIDSGSGCIPLHPILSYLLFPPFFSPHITACSVFLGLADKRRDTFLQLETHTEKFIYIHEIFFLSPSHDQNTFTQAHAHTSTHTHFSSSTHCVLCGFTISASPHGLVSLRPQLAVRKVIMTGTL